LGVGVISTAIKRAAAPDESRRAAVASMTLPNERGAQAALDAGATGCTDVTGFGLLGHLGRMAAASGVDVRIDVDTVPYLPGVRALAEDGMVPGGTQRNLAWAARRLSVPPPVEDLDAVLLADAQTSGGLLFGASPDRAERAVATLRAEGHDAALVGAVTGTGAGTITLDR
jgi:selenide, water dikinase